MKVIAYMHITPNGMIARFDGKEFSSEKAKKGFLSMIKKIKVNIVGRKTFESSLKSGKFPFDGFNVVVTHRKIKSRWENVIFTDKKPREILDIVRKKGYNSAMIGGGKLVTSFMRDNLVDDLYLDIEPIVFGKGIRMFSQEDFENRLKLVSLKRFSKDEVQLHYKIIK